MSTDWRYRCVILILRQITLHYNQAMHTQDFNYDLPERLIAHAPTHTRDESRLMVVNRQTQEISRTGWIQIGPKEATNMAPKDRRTQTRKQHLKHFLPARAVPDRIRHLHGALAIGHRAHRRRRSGSWNDMTTTQLHDWWLWR